MKNKDKQVYLQTGGKKCPYCKSKKIEATVKVVRESPFINQNVSCLKCGKKWLDVYTLTDVLTEN